MSVLNDAMDMMGLSKRKSVMGLPIGPKQTDWQKVAWGAGATTAGVVGTRAIARSRQDGSEEGNGLMEKGKEMVQRPKELVDQGKDAMESASTIGDKVSDVSEAVGDESSTFGKIKSAVQAFGGDGGDSGEGQEKKQRLIIHEQIDVAVPRSVAYERWTDFEEFDEISRAVRQVEPEDGGGEEDGEDEQESQKWQAKILVSSRDWTANVTDRVPEKRIAWETEGDVDHTGAVTFHELDDSLTRIHVVMEYHPSGFVEKFGNLFLTVRHRVRKDLRLFRYQLEMQGVSEKQEGEEQEEPQEAGQEQAEEQQGEDQPALAQQSEDQQADEQQHADQQAADQQADQKEAAASSEEEPSRKRSEQPSGGGQRTSQTKQGEGQRSKQRQTSSAGGQQSRSTSGQSGQGGRQGRSRQGGGQPQTQTRSRQGGGQRTPSQKQPSKRSTSPS